MTVASQTDLQTAVVAAAQAAVGTVALVGEAEPAPATGPDVLLPGPGSRAVAGDLRGVATGAIALVLAPLAAEAVSGEFAEAAQAALAAAAAVLGEALGGELSVPAAGEVAAEVAVATGPVVAARIVSGGTHIGTLAVRVDPPPVPAQGGPVPAQFAPLPAAGPRPAVTSGRLELLADVQMAVTVELGRTRMTVRDLLSLAPGAVVELDRAAGSPVDLYVHGRLIARGEVVVVDEEFGVRITEIVGPDATPGR